MDALNGHMNHDLICRIIRYWQDGSGGPKGSGIVHGYPQTEGYNLDTKESRELRMENSSSFFNYMRKEPHIVDKILKRVGIRIQKSDTTSGVHLIQALGLPEHQERSKSEAEAPRLTIA